MKDLRKRYIRIANVEAVLISLLIIFGTATVIAFKLFWGNKPNVILLIITVVLILGLFLADRKEKKILKEFFLRGCQNGANMYSFVQVLTLPEKLKKSISTIFFEEKEGKYAICVTYKTKNVDEIPCYINEVKDNKAIDRIPIPDLKDLDFYISIT